MVFVRERLASLISHAIFIKYQNIFWTQFHRISKIVNNHNTKQDLPQHVESHIYKTNFSHKPNVRTFDTIPSVTRRKSSNATRLNEPNSLSKINPRINSRAWHFSSLSFSLFTPGQHQVFLIRPYDACFSSLQRFLDDIVVVVVVVASGIGPSLPLSTKLPRRLLQKWPKGTSRSCRPSFRLNRATPTFSWQNRVSASVREARIFPSPSLRLSGGGSARLGTRHRRRRRRPEKLSRDGEQSNPPRDLSASFQFSDVSSAPSRKLTSRRFDGREGGGLDCSRKPAGERGLLLADIARGPAFFFDTVMRMDFEERSNRRIPLCRGDTLVGRSIGGRWSFRRNFYLGRHFFDYGANFI